jgi:hypothetical protein
VLRAYSTKITKRVPVEFQDNYIKHGMEVCEQMYGKRATARYRFILGASKLKRARRQYLEAVNAKTETRQGAPA